MLKITALAGIRERSRIWLFGIGVIILSLLLPKPVVGQADPHENRIGVYADIGGLDYCQDIAPITIGEAYLLVVNPTEADIAGWECRIETSPNITVIEWITSAYGGGVNQSAPPNFVVDLQTPLTIGGYVEVVMQITFMVTDVEPYWFLVLPADEPTVPGYAFYSSSIGGVESCASMCLHGNASCNSHSHDWITSDPAGMRFSSTDCKDVDSDDHYTPFSRDPGFHGWQLGIGPYSPQSVGITTYEFSHWSDGGDFSGWVYGDFPEHVYHAVFATVSEVSTTTLDFGFVGVNESLDKSFTIQNLTDRTLSGVITETCDNFSIVNGAAYNIGPGATHEVTVRFTPTDPVDYECTISGGINADFSDVTCTGTASACALNKLYVDAAVAGGTGDGSSWGNAFAELRDGLQAALDCPGVTEIWVADGIYKPTDSTDRNATFELRSGLALYGGFAGGETLLSERNLFVNPTILSGNIGLPGDSGDNCYHVVTVSGTDATAILDGFAIASGNADAGGGGIYNNGGSPTISNVTVMVNSAANLGGGMYNYNGNATLINAVFWGNSAGSVGGGLANMNASPTLINVTFYGNTAVNNGGGMASLTTGSVSLSNAVFWGNTPAGIYNSGAQTNVSHSLVQGGLTAGCVDGGGNIDANPLFVNAGVGNLHLSEGSPAIDAGDNSVPGLPMADHDGRPRIAGGTVDMGAYEFALALCVLSPPTFDFGRVEVGNTQSASFTIRNAGYETISGNVSAPCADYTILSGDGPFSLAYNDSVIVDFQFTPTPASSGFSTCLIETGSPVCDRLVLVAGGGDGQRVYNAKDPSALIEAGNHATVGGANGIFVSGHTAYVADRGIDGASGLVIFDISDPANPDSIGAYHTAGEALNVYVSGDFAYVADSGGGLRILDVSDPANPNSVGHWDQLSARDVVVVGGYAYLANGGWGLRIFDVGDPGNPNLVWTHDTPGYAQGLFISGNHAFVADGDSGLRIIDISTPEVPVDAGYYDTPGSARYVCVKGDYAYVADNETGLLILDVSDPAVPILVGNYDTPHLAGYVRVSGVYAYVSDTWDGAGVAFHVIDVSEPSNPVLLETTDTHSSIGIAVREGGDVACTAYAGYEHAVINSVTDVPNDQGGYVRINMTRSIYDFVAEKMLPIASYQVWRRIDGPALLQALKGAGSERKEVGLRNAASGGEDEQRLPDWQLTELKGRYFLQAPAADDFPPGTWEFMHSVFATQQENYIINTTTVADSSSSGMPYAVYVITAHTTTPSIWYASDPDSGYSVDNIPPGVPLGFAVAYNTGSGNQLTWNPSPEPDFQYYRIYRGDNEDFIPAPGNLVHETATESWSDPEYDGWDAHYKITAIDYAGNESEAALPGTATAVTEPSIPKVFALHQNIPNPFNPTTAIPYDVPKSGGHVTLQIYDVEGRLVRTLVDESQAPGVKRASWDARNNRGATVATGVYFYRMTGPGFEMTRKMVLLR